MRANNRIYHVDCFRCSICNKQLAPGDEFALRTDAEFAAGDNGGGGLLCKLDNELFEKQLSSSSSSSSTSSAASSSTSSSSSTIASNNTTCQNITNLQPMINANSSSGLGLMNGGLGSGMSGVSGSGGTTAGGAGGMNSKTMGKLGLVGGLDDSQINEFEGLMRQF